MPDPGDPITPLAEGANQLHELYVAYVEAGFTETQAMRLVIAVIQAGSSGS